MAGLHTHHSNNYAQLRYCTDSGLITSKMKIERCFILLQTLEIIKVISQDVYCIHNNLNSIHNINNLNSIHNINNLNSIHNVNNLNSIHNINNLNSIHNINNLNSIHNINNLNSAHYFNERYLIYARAVLED